LHIVYADDFCTALLNKMYSLLKLIDVIIVRTYPLCYTESDVLQKRSFLRHVFTETFLMA